MWKKICNFDNYSVSESGVVRNDVSMTIKKPFINKNTGYKLVDLYVNGKKVRKSVHRIVAEAFIENVHNLPCVDHIDGVRTNNNATNLRWASFSENNSRFGTIGVRSEKIIVTRFSEERNKRGGGHVSWIEPCESIEFDRICDAAEYFNCTQGNITPLLKSGEIGRRGKMRGYKFEYCKQGKVV